MTAFDISYSFYVVQNVKTGLFLPAKNTKSGGATAQEFSGIPRLFARKRDARSSAKWWCDGVWFMSGGSLGGYFDDPDDPDLCVTRKPERKLEDLRIVPLTYTLGKPMEIAP